MKSVMTAGDIIALLQERGYSIVGYGIDEHVWAPVGQERYLVVPADTRLELAPDRTRDLLQALGLTLDADGRIVALEPTGADGYDDATDPAGMRSLVAGGAGMVGSHLVDALVARGHQVTVVDNFITGFAANLPDHEERGIVLVDADLVDFDPGAEWARERFDRIYHLASPASPIAYGRHSIATLRVNAEGTRRLLDLAAAHGARFLLASTSEVYGDPLVVPQREEYWGNVNPIGPRSCYDEGKRYAEALTVTYGRELGLDVRIARIFNTYGPRSAIDDGRVIPNFIGRALRDEPIPIYGDGLQTRSFCYVSDLVDGLITLMAKPGLSGEVVNLGNPDERTIRQIAEAIVRLTASASPIVHEPLPVDDPARRSPDIGRARALLGWWPQVDFETGLTRTIEAFRAAAQGETGTGGAERAIDIAETVH